MGGCTSIETKKQKQKPKQKQKKAKQPKETSIVDDLQSQQIEQKQFDNKTKRVVDEKSFEMIQQFIDHCNVYVVQSHVSEQNHKNNDSYCQSVARQFQDFKKESEIENKNQILIKKQQSKIENQKQSKFFSTQNPKSTISTTEDNLPSQLKNHQILKSYFQLRDYKIELEFL